MEFDTEKIDEAVLALLYLTLHDDRVWKSFDWNAMSRLHEKGFILLLCVAVLSTTTAGAQEPFFKGKTVRVIVGFSPGGSFDVYSRVR